MGFLDRLNQIGQIMDNLATPGSPGPGGPMQPPSSMPSNIRPYSITESVSVTLDGSGNGQVTITPGQVSPGGGVGSGRNSGLSWDLTGCYVSVSTNTDEASATSYISYGIQSSAATDAVGQTELGSTGDTCTATAHMLPGDWLTTVWTGGDPGSIATMRVIGTVNPPGTGG